MSFPFVQARFDYGPRKGPALGFVIHMAEGAGTVGYLSRDPARGVSVHYVIETSGRVVQMLLEAHASGSINPTELRTTDDPDGLFGVSAARAVLGAWAGDPNSAVLSVEIEGYARDGPNNQQVIGLQALIADIRSRHPAIGLLGHRDFQDYKMCPGRLIPWALIGGHGPQEETMQAPITDEVEKIVTTAAGTTWYELDGKTIASPGAGRSALGPRPSPYGVGSRRAIFVTLGGVRRTVLVSPATVIPVPSPAPDETLKSRIEAAVVAAIEATS